MKKRDSGCRLQCTVALSVFKTFVAGVDGIMEGGNEGQSAVVG